MNYLKSELTLLISQTHPTTSTQQITNTHQDVLRTNRDFNG
jgi:hypothetical protein